MATPDQMAEIEEALGDDSGVLFLEPRHFFDTFVIGTGERGNDTFLIYDKAAMVEAMAKSISENEDEDEDFDPETSALEHFDFNMNQGGDGHPVYASLVCEEEPVVTAPMLERRTPGERRHGIGGDLPNLHERRSTYRRKGDWAQYLARGRS